MLTPFFPEHVKKQAQTKHLCDQPHSKRKQMVIDWGKVEQNVLEGESGEGMDNGQRDATWTSEGVTGKGV